MGRRRRASIFVMKINILSLSGHLLPTHPESKPVGVSDCQRMSSCQQATQPALKALKLALIAWMKTSTSCACQSHADGKHSEAQQPTLHNIALKKNGLPWTCQTLSDFAHS